MRIKFTANAQQELHVSALWYEEERPGLGAEFMLSTESTIDSIRRSPNLYPTAFNTVRRAIIKRFPFGVFFEEFEDEIVIYSIFHLRRNPKHPTK